VQLEYHAKPTHLIAGLFGSYVLVGDTVGNLMLADTKSSARPQLRGSRYLDAALFIESNAQRPRAIVVFESGKSELVVLDDPNAASEFELGTKDTIAVAFSPTAAVDRFVTASKSGQVDVWEFDGGRPTRLASFDHGGVPVGLASFSSGGERAISLGGDGTVKVWDVAGRTLLATFPQTSGQ
jgi:WD40 repeat protein